MFGKFSNGWDVSKPVAEEYERMVLIPEADYRRYIEQETTLRNIKAMLNVTDSDTKNADKSRKER